MTKTPRYQTYMTRFDRNGDHRGNDLDRRMLDEHKQRGPNDDRCQQAGGDQLEHPSGRPRQQLRGQPVVRAAADRRRNKNRCRRTARISVALSGIPSGTLKPGDPPTEVELMHVQQLAGRLPQGRCRAGTDPLQLLDLRIGLPDGTADRFDPATGSWIKLQHPVIGTGMDYLGGFTDVQELPRGKAVTLRYRIALDAWKAEGKGRGGGDRRVMTDPLVWIGEADMPFTVGAKDSTTPPKGPRPTLCCRSRASTDPRIVAVDGAGNVYVIDNSGFGRS